MEKTITNLEKVPATLTPNGTLASPPQWAVLSGSATVDAAPDGLSAMLISGDAVETSQIQVTSGTLSETIDLIVTEPAATTLGLSIGDAIPK